MNTVITTRDGGTFFLYIIVQDNSGAGIAFVEIYMNGSPLGVYLPVIDEASGLYGFSALPVEAGAAAAQYLVEYRAMNNLDALSHLFPYLTVED